MLIISAKSPEQAALEARRRSKSAYVYIPEDDDKEREERIRGIHGVKLEQFVGHFSFIERIAMQLELG